MYRIILRETYIYIYTREERGRNDTVFYFKRFEGDFEQFTIFQIFIYIYIYIILNIQVS